jgi:hypothetical protein
VEGLLRPDNSINASKITVLPDGTPQPTPTAIATPAATSSPVPVATASIASPTPSGQTAPGTSDADKVGSDSEDNNDQGNNQQDNGTHPVVFRGTVQQMPASGLAGTWRIGGRTVYVDGSTHIDQQQGPLVVGAYVQVQGVMQPDGSIHANTIQTKKSHPGKKYQGGSQEGNQDQSGNGGPGHGKHVGWNKD